MQFISYYLYSFVRVLTYPLYSLLYAPQRIFTGTGGWLRRISVPARVAILTTIFLVITVVITMVIFYSTEDRTFAGAKAHLWFWIGITLLVVAIPIVLYKALKLWLEGDVSPFPDIDHAWKVGLAELDNQGLDLTQIPLFLILGSTGEDHEKSLFDASQLNLNMRDVPQGPNALHWYANPDGIYLVCTDTSSLSRLSAIAGKTSGEEAAGGGPAATPASSTGDGIRGTVVVGSEGGGGPLEPASDAPPPETSAAAPPNIRGTMVVGNQTIMPGGGDSGVVSASSEKKVIKLEQRTANEQDRRLEYVCRLIRRARHPLCPINGILTMLPFSLIQRSVPEAIEVQRALKKDLATVLRMLKLRCPVTSMVTGLEAEGGFRELVRRVGRSRAMGNRFGKGFAVLNPPTAERLKAVAAHACGSFEDWVYTLFREKGALSKPGNTKLYALLCKIRRNVHGRLANMLEAGYAADPDVAEPLLFSGCYFAATGASDGCQAFIKGVFDKLPDQQEELDWTEAAYEEDERYQKLTRLVLGVDTLLILVLATLAAGKWWLGWF